MTEKESRIIESGDEKLVDEPVDPFPFILLNLLLSMIAAIQAPLIMMSQNREEKRNEEKATSDFFINVKSELLIEDIHTNVERIVRNQEEILAYLRQACDKDEGDSPEK